MVLRADGFRKRFRIGRTVLPLDDALRVIEQEGIFWTRV